jgi:pimeloyl-ACP methyl ester carboxylesterase
MNALRTTTPAGTGSAGPRNHASDLRGLGRLAVEATRGVTDVVEEMHRNISPVEGLLGKPAAGRTGGITGLVYQTIRGVTGLVGTSLDALLAPLVSRLGDTASFPEREALVGVINGVVGDHLAATHNPLAIELRIRRRGRPLDLEREALRAAIPEATGKLLVMVHGSSMNDLQWTWKGHDHGAALERDLGYTAVQVHYNSGLHISENGRALAEQLEALVAAWPVPVEELTLLGHSMGGLVSRSACCAAAAAGHRWPGALRRMIFLGTPHHGAPLERGGNWVDLLLGISPYSAPLARLGKIRSAGVTDLRFGNIRDEDWQGRDRFEHGADRRLPAPLPEGVACYTVAATTAPADRAALPGDGLVPLASALGHHPRPEMTLAIPEARRRVVFGTKHLDLLGSAEVYEVLRGWLSADAG